jgi:hypothetical protein
MGGSNCKPGTGGGGGGDTGGGVQGAASRRRSGTISGLNGIRLVFRNAGTIFLFAVYIEGFLFSYVMLKTLFVWLRVHRRSGVIMRPSKNRIGAIYRY